MIRRLRRLWWEAQLEKRTRALFTHATRHCQGAAHGPCETWEAMCDYHDDALNRYRALL